MANFGASVTSGSSGGIVAGTAGGAISAASPVGSSPADCSSVAGAHPHMRPAAVPTPAKLDSCRKRRRVSAANSVIWDSFASFIYIYSVWVINFVHSCKVHVQASIAR